MRLTKTGEEESLDCIDGLWAGVRLELIQFKEEVLIPDKVTLRGE